MCCCTGFLPRYHPTHPDHPGVSFLGMSRNTSNNLFTPAKGTLCSVPYFNHLFISLLSLKFHFFLSSLFPSPLLQQLHPKLAQGKEPFFCCLFFCQKKNHRGMISPGGSALPHPSEAALLEPQPARNAINRWEQRRPLKATCITQSPLAQGS